MQDYPGRLGYWDVGVPPRGRWTRCPSASALAILALIGHFSRVQYLTEYQFWLAMIAYVALLLGVLFKGL